jgi:hypothetical protein
MIPSFIFERIGQVSQASGARADDVFQRAYLSPMSDNTSPSTLKKAKNRRRYRRGLCLNDSNITPRALYSQPCGL